MEEVFAEAKRASSSLEEQQKMAANLQKALDELKSQNDLLQSKQRTLKISMRMIKVLNCFQFEGAK